MIPVFKPLIQADEYEACKKALDLGWLGMGSFVSEFESAITEIIGKEEKYVAALNTGTSALHVALIVAGVKPGDEVIVPSFNASSDFQVINWIGAEVVFCDCREDSLGIDLDKARKLVSSKTKAVIIMDYDCILVDYDAVKEFASEFNLRVIHDAAHSFGSYYKDQIIGSFSDICVFSHDPVKTITCLDGGSIVVNTKEELLLVHKLRLLGMQQPASVMYQNKRAWTFDIEDTGFRYHMINLHAAVGIAQLAKLDFIRTTRQEACKLYVSLLHEIKQIKLPETNFENINPFLFYIRILDGSRDEFRKFLLEHGVDTGIHWIPGHKFSLWKDAKKGDLSVTNVVAEQIVSLPLHSNMNKDDITYICKQIKDFFTSI